MSARPGLCGGQSAMVVPTAIANRPWVLMKRLPWSLQHTQQAGLQPPKYASSHKKKNQNKSSPVSILHLLLRRIGRAAIKL